jgi:hypothetical protein
VVEQYSQAAQSWLTLWTVTASLYQTTGMVHPSHTYLVT